MAETEEQNKKETKLFYRMEAEDVDLATDIRTSILAQSPRGGRAIIYVVLALFVLFLVWAYFSEIEDPEIIRIYKGRKHVGNFFVYRLRSCKKLPADVLEEFGIHQRSEVTLFPPLVN